MVRLPAKSLRGQLSYLLFTAGVSEVDPALFHAIDDRADQERKAERLRHVGVHLTGNLPEVVEMFLGERDRLQLVAAAFAGRWHQVHADSSTLGESAEGISLPPNCEKLSGAGKNDGRHS